NQDADRLSRLAARGDAFRGIAPGRAPQVLRRSFRFRAGGPRLKVRAPMNPVFVALDTMDRGRARALAAAVRPHVGGLKLGLEFFCANGPEAVRDVADDAPLFLDLKLHDIPNTVAGAVRAVLPLRPAFLTVHAAGGPAMLRAAVDAAAGETRLLGVTVLTSLDDGDLDRVGQRSPVADQVRRLALLAREAGLSGVVCSPHEIKTLRAECGPDFLLV